LKLKKSNQTQIEKKPEKTRAKPEKNRAKLEKPSQNKKTKPNRSEPVLS
jgi:hypothetical protein